MGFEQECILNSITSMHKQSKETNGCEMLLKFKNTNFLGRCLELSTASFVPNEAMHTVVPGTLRYRSLAATTARIALRIKFKRYTRRTYCKALVTPLGVQSRWSTSRCRKYDCIHYSMYPMPNNKEIK
jgi:hypothetical protein